MSELSNDNVVQRHERFMSLSDLRMQHTRLLRRQREVPGSPEVLKYAAEFIRRAQATGVVLETDSDRTTAQTLLDYWVTLLIRAGVETHQASLEEFDPSLLPSLSEEQCPYCALDTFPPDPSNHYLGRERLLKQCLTQLQQNHLLVIVGPSGSGRSSLLEAVLLPVLKAGGLAGSQNWRYYPALPPSRQPLADLVHLLLAANQSSHVAEGQEVKLLLDRPGHLTELLVKCTSGPVVFVVDGFERLASVCPKREGDALLNNLLAVAAAPEARHYVILVLNSDHLGDIAQTEQWRPILTNQVLVAFDANELRLAIEEPAKLVGLRFEEGLVGKLLLDVTGDPSAATLLQFTLLGLWEQRQGNRITWQAYNTLGGGREALARAAEALYLQLTPREQEAAKRILILTVSLGLGKEVNRVLVPRTATDLGDPSGDQSKAVLAKLIRARLVRFIDDKAVPGGTIKLAHQALASHWPRFAGWLDEERESKRRRLRLTAAAEQWRDKQRDPGALWRGSLLEEAKAYSDLTDVEEEFIKASSSAQIRERRRERQRRYAGIGALCLIIASLWVQLLKTKALARADEASKLQAQELAALEKAKREQADRVAALEKSKREQAQQVAVLEENKREQADRVAALEAAKRQQAQELADAERKRTEQAEAARTNAEALQRRAEDGEKEAERQRTYALAQVLAREAQYALGDRGLLLARQAYVFNSESKEPISSLVDDALRSVLSRPKGVPLPDFLSGGIGVPIFSVAFDPNGQSVVAAGRDGSVFSWDLSTNGRAPLIMSSGNQGSAVVAAISPNGRFLAMRINNTNIIIRDFVDSNAPAALLVSDKVLSALRPVFSPDSRVLAAGCPNGFVQVWALGTGGHSQASFQVVKDGGPPAALAFSPDGQVLAAGGRDGNVWLWNSRDGNPWQPPGFLAGLFQTIIGPPKPEDDPNVLRGSTNPVASIAFAPAGNAGHLVALGSVDGTVQLRDWLRRTNGPDILSAGGGPISATLFSPDGRFLAAASWDRTIRLWDLLGTERGPIAVFRENQDGVTSLAFSPDSQELVSGSIDQTVRLWDLHTREELPTPANPRIIRDRDYAAYSVAFSTDGHTLAAGSWDGTIRIFHQGIPKDPGSGPLILRLPAPALAVGLNKNGELLAVGSLSGAVRVWDFARSTNADMPSLNEPVVSVALSQDGESLAAGSVSGSVRIWSDIHRSDIFTNLQAHSAGVSVLAYNYDKSQLASGSWDGSAHRWALSQGVLSNAFSLERGAIVSAMAFSPDGATFAVGTADGTVYRWKLGAPNSSPDTLEGHEGRVSSLAFNRSGQLLASGGFDSTVRIWDLRQGAHPTILKLRSQHTTSPVLSVAFSDDGRTVFSSSASETMLSWIGPAEELTESTGVLAEQVCKRVARNLTTNEWTQYVAQYVGTNQAPKCTCTNLPPCEQVAQRSSAARQ